MSRSIGIQLREYQSIQQLIKQADALNLSSFQFFLNAAWDDSKEANINHFKKESDRFTSIFVHASYRINLAHSFTYHPLLEHELHILNQYDLFHYVIHPGSLTFGISKKVAIERIVATLNTVLKKYPRIEIILENTPKREQLIGADLEDLKTIYELLYRPEKIFFCIDTAHAFSAGYDIVSSKGLTEFYDQCDQLLGNKIALLHLNDTIDACGSGRDQHAYPGKGQLGIQVIKKVMKRDTWKTIPIILEPPPLSIDALKTMLKEIENLQGKF